MYKTALSKMHLHEFSQVDILEEINDCTGRNRDFIYPSISFAFQIRLDPVLDYSWDQFYAVSQRFMNPFWRVARL